MADRRDRDAELQTILDRLAADDEKAVDDLITHSNDRLQRLARKMLGQNPRVRRWHSTGDVLQNAMMRLMRSVKEVKPATVKAYVGLAATQIRRELIDLARHEFGPEGAGANHASDPRVAGQDGKNLPAAENAADPHTGPQTQAQWQEFHEQVQRLPEEEREVFDLLFYQGLTQEVAAKHLGVSVPTVKRRWREARLKLHEVSKARTGEL
jgi:RNA polymerase sigma-70 factor (ECF subfamily)